MQKPENIGITIKKEENFSEWYVEVVQKAELADYSAVKGCMVIRPNAYSIWENIQSYFDKRIKELKVKNAYFPLFIPESFFKREAEHASGFKPEVAWIANTEEEGERLAVRPTSETVIYDSYSTWIRSHRDLPLRINQWCNIVRWETKTTRLFLRTREFLWQEGHCVYETKEECDKETLMYLEEYKKLCEDILAIPVLVGKKTDNEKFAGALYTTSIEAIMPDGKTLQMGTSHNLGQGFAKSFNIKFLGKDGKEHMPWQNSWGVSTRLIGALIMTHGDDKGMVVPPNLASIKAVIIPILFEKTEEVVLKKAKEIEKKLKDYSVILDDRKEYTPGWKFHQYELEGIPLRIEIGPKDLDKDQVIIARRDTSEKKQVKIKDVEKEVKILLEEIQQNLFNKAKKSFESKIVYTKSLQELKKLIDEKKVVKVSLCGSKKCEEELTNSVEALKSLNMPFNQSNIKDNCISCSKKASVLCYFGKSY